jgi:hypothetical protein
MVTAVKTAVTEIRSLRRLARQLWRRRGQGMPVRVRRMMKCTSAGWEQVSAMQQSFQWKRLLLLSSKLEQQKQAAATGMPSRH